MSPVAQMSLIAVWFFVACGPGSTAAPDIATCPSDLPATCVSPAPSYASSVSDIVRTRCATCHSPSGIASDRPFTTYAQIFAQRSPMLHQAYTCRMPPINGAPLTADDRAALLAWFVCGAPNN